MSAAIFLREARQSWRGLLRRPGYLLLAVATLALGVGTSTAVFALIDQALLQPLPFPQAERLVTVGRIIDDNSTAGPAYLRVVRDMRTVQSAGMIRSWVMEANVAHGDVAQVVRALHADRGFLQTLGLPMALGRNFSADEDRRNGPAAVLLSHAYWQRGFAGDSAVIGKVLLVEGRAAQVVGVLPADFRWPESFDVILPLQPDPATSDISTNELIVARLADGASIAQASAEAVGAIGNMLRANPAFISRGESAVLGLQRVPPGALPIKSSVFVSRSGSTLWLFLAAAGCVLLIATVNLAGLMLLRTLGRSHDQAVRQALGAPASRLAWPMLAEGTLIGMTAAAVGLLLAWAGLRGLAGVVPLEWLRGEPPALGLAGVACALVMGTGAACLAAALGLWRLRHLHLVGELVDGGRGGWSRSSGRLGRVLVVVQIALAVVLLTGASLFIRTLHELSKVPMGFESHAVSIFELSLVKAHTPGLADAMTATTRIIERVQRIPGVVHVAASSNPPTTTQLNLPMVLPDGRELGSVQFRLMTPRMLEVFGIPLLAGRGISDRDGAGGERVGLVSASFAKVHLRGDPLGQRVTLDTSPRVPMRVVGVVGDVRQFGPTEPAPPIVYIPFAQLPDDVWQVLRGFGGMTYSVRMQQGMSIDQQTLQRAIAEVAPGQPISELRQMESVVASTTSQQKLNLLLVGLFAALALLLASVGLYAVMATSVAARRHEFGVRAALGAPPLRLLRQVLMESGRQIALGLTIGLAVALAGSRVLQGFLFGVSAADPLAIALVLGVLALTGTLAALVPALRASRVPPMQALRT